MNFYYLGPITDGTVRLSADYNSGGANEGNVEIYHNGTWGSICYYSFSMKDAQVICRQLGYPNATATQCCSHYGSNQYNLTWLGILNCTGSENKVIDCPSGSNWEMNINGCNRYSKAGVVCQGNEYRSMNL